MDVVKDLATQQREYRTVKDFTAVSPPDAKEEFIKMQLNNRSNGQQIHSVLSSGPFQLEIMIILAWHLTVYV